MVDGRSILSTIVQSAVVDLFREYGIAVAPVPRRASGASAVDNYLGATIGFSEKSMTGTLNLFVAESLLTTAKQMSGFSFKVEDFARELVNQLLGRIKNRMLLYQIELKVGLPRMTSQTTADTRQDTKQERLEFHFRGLRGGVRVNLQGSINYSAIVYSGIRVAGVEGDVILF
jgi:predicted phage-related endonuclease